MEIAEIHRSLGGATIYIYVYVYIYIYGKTAYGTIYY